MKLTTTETLKYTAAVVKLSAGASLSRAEYDQFRALVEKMRQAEPKITPAKRQALRASC